MATSSNAVFVKGIDTAAADDEIRQVFAPYGEVQDIARPTDKNFCFVTFATEAEAQAAVDAGAQEIGGVSCTVDLRRGQRRQGQRNTANPMPAGMSTSLYIPSVSEEATEDDLRNAFGRFGDIKSIKFRHRMNNRDGRPFVFVEFMSRGAMEGALAAATHNVAGEEVTVQERLSAPRTARDRRERRDHDHYHDDDAPAAAPPAHDQGAAHAGGGERRRDGRSGRRRGGGGGGGGAVANGVASGVAAAGGHLDAPPVREGRLPVPPKQENSVYIRGFPPETTEDEIRSHFGKYGAISSVIMRVKGEADDVRTWAFVEYDSVDKVAAAVASADGTQINGVEVAVEARKSEPKLFRPMRGRGGRYRGGGGGGGGGRGGGRRRRPHADDEGGDDA